jgi:Ca2+-binding EF-hand superfamily protein
LGVGPPPPPLLKMAKLKKAADDGRGRGLAAAPAATATTTAALFVPGSPSAIRLSGCRCFATEVVTARGAKALGDVVLAIAGIGAGSSSSSSSSSSLPPLSSAAELSFTLPQLRAALMTMGRDRDAITTPTATTTTRPRPRPSCSSSSSSFSSSLTSAALAASIFATLDPDATGRVTARQLLRALYPGASASQRRQLERMAGLGDGGDAAAAAKAAAKAAARAQREEALREVEAVFRLFDGDGSESLDRDEFVAALAVAGVCSDEDAAARVFAEVDADGGGSVSYGEYRDWYLRMAGGGEEDGGEGVEGEGAAETTGGQQVSVPAPARGGAGGTARRQGWPTRPRGGGGGGNGGGGAC